MNALEHIYKIEEIAKERKEEEKRNNLFGVGSQISGAGLGFSTMQVQTNTIGGVTHVNTIENGNIGYSTIASNPCGITITRHW